MAQPFNFGARRKEVEDKGLLGSGDYLKIKEGDNRMRLASECIEHVSDFQGKRTFKWLCYVIDRKDGKVKPFFMPHSIYKQIEALQTNEDYAFESVPMPYDITVTAIGAGTKEVKYTVIPARKESPVTAGEYQELAKATPLHELQRKLYEKKPVSHDGPVEHPDDPGPMDEPL